MPIAVNGSGTITGISVGGLPDGCVDTDTLATSVTRGKILQVIQAVKTDTFSHLNEAFADITGLSVAITPTSSSSKIMIRYGGCMGSGSNRLGHIKLLRGSTDIFIGDQGATTSQARSSSSCMQSQTYSISAFGGEFLDSPATTNATTYKLQIAAGDQDYQVHVGRSHDNSNEFSRSKTPSFITVMEVAA
jgi:hypothetical protein